MSNTFVLSRHTLSSLVSKASSLRVERFVWVLSLLLAISASIYSFLNGYTVAYGDSESHLNIAKRVIDSLTPGFAQLGGIWLPLPHILLIPFVSNDWLWRTGLAGSIVSGASFVIASVHIYKLMLLLSGRRDAAFIAALVFMLNPNILYLQSTPMTELPLIVFFVLSTYHFIRFLKDDANISALILAALFGFCASLSRYDGWALVSMQVGVLFLHYLPRMIFALQQRTKRKRTPMQEEDDVRPGHHWEAFEGAAVLYSTLAFFGILLWLIWGWLILGDPLYFTHSEFSANSQQMSWYARGELPAYHNVCMALKYYFFTSAQTVGTIVGVLAAVGMVVFLLSRDILLRAQVLLILLVPFFFNVLTLWLGQSVIFLPGVTPTTFEWTLFNVRYGTMMVPAVAIFVGYLFSHSKVVGRGIISAILALQTMLFLIGFTPVLSFQDGVYGLSSAVAKMPDAQNWLSRNYDYGQLLTDDFARTISIVRSPVKMEDVIYVGNKPYWEESLVEPQKYARWIVIQKDDTLWKSILGKPEVEDRLYKYFNKVYTANDEILIFRRIDEDDVPASLE